MGQPWKTQGKELRERQTTCTKASSVYWMQSILQLLALTKLLSKTSSMRAVFQVIPQVGRKGWLPWHVCSWKFPKYTDDPRELHDSSCFPFSVPTKRWGCRGRACSCRYSCLFQLALETVVRISHFREVEWVWEGLCGDTTSVIMIFLDCQQDHKMRYIPLFLLLDKCYCI